MSGAVLALSAGGVAGGSGSTTPAPLNWANLYGGFWAFNAALTISGIGAGISITATETGGAALYYDLNGTITLYTGAFTVHASDTLSWGVHTTTTAKSGTITITNATTATVLDTFSFTVTGGS